jgi:hypothetical protein
MRKFITKLAVFVFIFFTIILTSIYTGYKSLGVSDYFKISENIKFIVLGHSHAEDAYNDKLISNFANLGKSGESYFYTYVKLKSILPENKQIQTVFIEFENNQIDSVMNSWTYDEQHIYQMFPKFLPILEYTDFKFLWKKNHKAILNCNPKSFVINSGHDLISTLTERRILDEKKFGGFIYLKKNETDSIIDYLSKKIEKRVVSHELSTINIDYLTKIINYSKSENRKLFLIRSPLHEKYEGYQNEIIFQKILLKNFSNVEYLDFSKFPILNNEFADLGHLNYKGSKKFSVWFDRLIKYGLLEKKNKQNYIDNEINELIKKNGVSLFDY